RTTACGIRSCARERSIRVDRRRTHRQSRRTRLARNLPAAARDQRVGHRRADGDAQPRARAYLQLPQHRAQSGPNRLRFSRRCRRRRGGGLMLALRNAMIAFRRAPLLSVLSITTIAFSLFAFGLFGLVALNIKNALQQVEERVEMRAFAKDGTPIDAIAAASESVARYPEVLKVDVVTQAQALERARKELGEFKDVFDGEFLPASLDVRLKPGFRDPVTV